MYGFIPTRNVDNNNHVYVSNKYNQNRDTLEYNVHTREYRTYDDNEETELSNNTNIKNFSTGTFLKNVRKQESDNEVPLIHYNSFLSFCTRHCGSWIGTFKYKYLHTVPFMTSLHIFSSPKSFFLFLFFIYFLFIFCFFLYHYFAFYSFYDYSLF